MWKTSRMNYMPFEEFENVDNQVTKYLKFARDHDFELGQILVKYTRSLNYSVPWSNGQKVYRPWKQERFSSAREISYRKYKVVHKDEFGICYIKKMLKDGSTSTYHNCLANIDYDFTKFEVDPDYIDWLLIGGKDKDYDPNYDYKEEVESAKADKARKLNGAS